MACSGWFQSGDMGRKDAAYSGLYWVSDSCRDGEIFVRVLILFFPWDSSKNCSGWWLADRLSAVTLLCYAYTNNPTI